MVKVNVDGHALGSGGLSVLMAKWLDTNSKICSAPAHPPRDPWISAKAKTLLVRHGAMKTAPCARTSVRESQGRAAPVSLGIHRSVHVFQRLALDWKQAGKSLVPSNAE